MFSNTIKYSSLIKYNTKKFLEILETKGLRLLAFIKIIKNFLFILHIIKNIINSSFYYKYYNKICILTLNIINCKRFRKFPIGEIENVEIKGLIFKTTNMQ